MHPSFRTACHHCQSTGWQPRGGSQHSLHDTPNGNSLHSNSNNQAPATPITLATVGLSYVVDWNAKQGEKITDKTHLRYGKKKLICKACAVTGLNKNCKVCGGDGELPDLKLIFQEGLCKAQKHVKNMSTSSKNPLTDLEAAAINLYAQEETRVYSHLNANLRKYHGRDARPKPCDAKPCRFRQKYIDRRNWALPKGKPDTDGYCARCKCTGEVTDKDFAFLKASIPELAGNYQPYLELFIRACKKAPPKNGKTLYRGLNAQEAWVKKFKEGDEVPLVAVQSYSEKREVAERFAKGIGNFPLKVLFTLKTMDGNSLAFDIDKFSPYGKGEDEAVVMPGTRVKVERRYQKDGFEHIVLQEVERIID